MNFYLIRHGEAAPVGGGIVRDADRPLTSKGEHDVSIMAAALARLEEGVQLVLTSPLLRAHQTARILASHLPGTPDVLTTENLTPGFRRDTLLSDLITAGNMQAVAAVGHQPDLTAFLSFLIADGSYAGVAFPPAGIAKIVVHPSSSIRNATLHWLLTPDVIQRIEVQP